MVERTYTAEGVAVERPEALINPKDLRRISWGAVLAGAVIAIAVHFLLSLLGLGIGLSTVDTGSGQPPEAESFGIGAGIWWVVSNVVAIIIGGYVAARLEGLPTRGDGIIHGVLTWAVMLIVMIWLVTSAAGGIIGGAFNAVGSTLSAAGQGLAQAVPAVAESVSPGNLESMADRLLDRGGGAASGQGGRQGLIAALTTMATASGAEAAQARERAIGIVSQEVGISRGEAEQRLSAIEGELRQALQQVEETASDTARGAADVVSSAAIWGFFALLLGAIAGAIGGAVGTRRRALVVPTTTRP